MSATFPNPSGHDSLDLLLRKLIIQVSPTEAKLRTDAVITGDVVLSPGDIQIGAVELKDGTTDTRVKAKSDGTDNALVVFQNVQPLPTGAATATAQATILAAIQAGPVFPADYYPVNATLSGSVTYTFTTLLSRPVTNLTLVTDQAVTLAFNGGTAFPVTANQEFSINNFTINSATIVFSVATAMRLLAY